MEKLFLTLAECTALGAPFASKTLENHINPKTQCIEFRGAPPGFGGPGRTAISNDSDCSASPSQGFMWGGVPRLAPSLTLEGAVLRQVMSNISFFDDDHKFAFPLWRSARCWLVIKLGKR